MFRFWITMKCIQTVGKNNALTSYIRRKLHQKNSCKFGIFTDNYFIFIFWIMMQCIWSDCRCRSNNVLITSWTNCAKQKTPANLPVLNPHTFFSRPIYTLWNIICAAQPPFNKPLLNCGDDKCFLHECPVVDEFGNIKIEDLTMCFPRRIHFAQ